MLDFLNHYSDAFTAIAALIASGGAIYGVNEWKRQFKWRIEYETAQKYVRRLYQLRDAINREVRNPAISSKEVEIAQETASLQGADVTRANEHWIVYLQRWQKVTEARTVLRESLLETEVLWGKDIGNAQRGLDLLIGELYGKIWSTFNNPGSRHVGFDTYLYHTDGNDDFTKRIQDAVEEIEKFVRPHLT